MAESTLPQTSPSLWKQGLGWLLLLGALFFITYGQVNQFTATRQDVGSWVFGWEQAIPFIPWTIVPYWSIDILYGISLFICTSRQELTRHGYRLVVASVTACGAFLLFPLKFTFIRPATEGFFGWLFQQLEQFDLPYNQAPSLHIILAWLLWLRFSQHLKGVAKILASCWFLLIAVSVLTTWQHHCIDVVSGLIVGVIISYALPMTGRWRWHRPSSQARRLAMRYASGGVGLLVASLCFPYCYVLYWPALSLCLVAAGYGGIGPAIFQKNTHGEMTFSARIVLLPYLLGARLSRQWFSRRLPRASFIVDGVYLGGFPDSEIQQRGVLDLTAEFSRSRQQFITWHACPLMDLVVPERGEVMQAVDQLRELQHTRGSVLVCCALGLSRSATIVAAWLLTQGYVISVAEAVEFIQARRPQVVLTPRHLDVLQQIQETV
ncbi:phosphatase PAP2/dual specificity phosphatase family protein [Atlantibacter subterraneus]|uniref:phosphatase PAP2/dual specificity phosphatase family protein n=1 Tax=Atlantibacter subterraneus TaxID=255519 RepID=UPI00289A96CA|nr:phosphatase PAP2/dual specificity phosphatase family protein [Atlantibacter subterranea]